MMRYPLIVLAFMMSTHFTSAQKTQIYQDIEDTYQKALELFEHEKYSAAQVEFEKVSAFKTRPVFDDQYAYKANAAFYRALCALELMNPDAELLFNNFITDYPGSPKTDLASFHLGKFYFRNKKYKEANEYFSKVRVADLGKLEKEDYYFQYGFCLFNMKKLQSASTYFYKLKDYENRYYYPANYYYGFIAFLDDDFNTALSSFEKIKNSKAYSRIIPYYMCQIYYAQDRLDELIEFAEPLMDDTRMKYYDKMNQLLGQSYFKKGEYDKALPYLNYYVKRASRIRKEDYYQLAFTQYRSGEINDAIDNLMELNNEEDSLGQNAMYILGKCYIINDDKENARNAFMAASRIDKDPFITENSKFNYGKLSYELGFYQMAITSFDDFLSTYPNSPLKIEAQGLLAESLLNTKNYSEALRIIEQIPNKSSSLKKAYQKVSYFRGIELFNDKRYSEAEDMFKRSLEYPLDGSISAGCNFWLGELAYNKQQYQKSIDYHTLFLDQARISAPPGKESSTATANYTLGYANYKLNRNKDALIYFDRVAKGLSGNTGDLILDKIAKDAVLRAADCAFMSKDYRKAEGNYEEVIRNRYPGVDYAIFQKGMLQGLQGQLEEKTRTLQKIINDYNKSVYLDDAYYEIGNTYVVLENDQQAINTFNKLLTSRPNSQYSKTALLKLGLIYYNRNDYKKALNYYKQVAEKYPDTGEGREAMDGIRDISIEQGNPDIYTSVASVTATERDSVTFLAAENKYQQGDCENAIRSFDKYLKEFPDGYFRNQSHFSRGECLFRNEDFGNALKDYEFLIDNQVSRYLETSLLKAARICYFKTENYKKASEYYKTLFTMADFKDNTLEAVKGILRSSYKLGEYNDVTEYADQLLKMPEARQDELIEANYYAGKAYFSRKQYQRALPYFEACSKLTSNELGVESRFNIAVIQFNNRDLTASKASCFKIINDMPTYEEWVIKSYILIADILVEEGDTFQAKASLQSIIDNYEGDPELVRLAQVKLDEIESKEKSRSKIAPKLKDDGQMELDPMDEDILSPGNRRKQ